MKPLTAHQLEIMVREELAHREEKFWIKTKEEPALVLTLKYLTRRERAVSDWLSSKEFKRILDAASQDLAPKRRIAAHVADLVQWLHEMRRDFDFYIRIHPSIFFSLGSGSAEWEHVRLIHKMFVDLESALPEDLHVSLRRLRKRALRAASQVAQSSGTLPVNLGSRDVSKSPASAWRALLVRELRLRLPAYTERSAACIAGLLRVVGDKEIDHRHVHSILGKKR